MVIRNTEPTVHFRRPPINRSHSFLTSVDYLQAYTDYRYITHIHANLPRRRMIMAMQVYSAAPRTSLLQNYASQGIIPYKQRAVVGVGADLGMKRMKGRRMGVVLTVKSSLDVTAAEVTAVVGKVTEVTKDTFWPIVKAAGDKTVVVDMYTQWCGPCKVIAPKYQELSKQYDDVLFLKLDCNQDNKPLAKELGIKVVPTFKILKEGNIVKEITGAKYDDLVAGIETVRSTE